MAELSLQGRSERLANIIALDREEIELHQAELTLQLAGAVEHKITRHIEVIPPLLAQIAFELSMRDSEAESRAQNGHELVAAAV